MLDIHALMKGLAEKRPVFHNEADFQFALASFIREECGQPVRLEWEPFPEGPTRRLSGIGQPTPHLVGQPTVSDYRPLTDHLETLRVSRLVATIPQLEEILRAKLPPSAKQDRKWWANVWKEPQAKSWMAAGWKTGRVRVGRRAVEAVEFRLRMSVDLWLPVLGVVIELKYSTRALRCDEYSADLDPPCESFSLREQGARDITRYDFLKDVSRLERVLARRPEPRRGIAILLTNDPLYWKRSTLYWKQTTKKKPIDEDFHLYEGRVLPRRPDRMHWVEGAETAKFRNVPIVLNGPYAVEWKCYGVVKSEHNARYGVFRYLAVEVSRESAGAPAGESPKNQPGCAPSP